MSKAVSQLLSEHGKVVLKDFSGASFAQILAKVRVSCQKPMMVVVDNQKQASELKDEIQFFLPDTKIGVMPSYDVRPYFGLSPHRRVVLQNLKIFYQLARKELPILIVPRQALIRRTLPRPLFESTSFLINKNDLIDREELMAKLVALGYERHTVVEDPGQFAVRGDIVDIFSPHLEQPFRLSFFDIEVEEIRYFNPVNQRTKDAETQVAVIPAHEVFLELWQQLDAKEPEKAVVSILEKAKPYLNADWKSKLKKRADKKEITKSKRDQVQEFLKNKIRFHGIEFFMPLFYQKLGTVFDYLDAETVIALDLDNSLGKIADHYIESCELERANSDHIESIYQAHEVFLTGAEVQENLSFFNCAFKDGDIQNSSQQDNVVEYLGKTESNLLLKSQIVAKISQVHSLAPLVSELNQKRLDGYSCYVICQNDVQLERVADLLQRFELPLKALESSEQKEVLKDLLVKNPTERLVSLMVGHMHQGFIDHGNQQWWITDQEIFGKKTRRAGGKKRQTAVFSSFSELSDGDYLIHMDHGIGIFKGLVKLEYDVHQNDFLLVEYLAGDKLYVPINNLNRVQRYMAEEGSAPQLDKLGGQTWLKTRNKAKRAARKLAKELLEIQAKRNTLKGYPYQPHIEEMEEFASSFEFEETVDQLSAISDVKSDMASEQPMDRLICGDVGYGKTEVAIRAAYKAVLDQKQVAVLVPTTVLAFQHYTTFKERLKNYSVSVDLLSRFRTTKEQNAAVQKMKEGSLDIVIGTHRLLSKDIKFRDLGLLVIDEEHRFGVIHKEKVKKMRALVDTVTLTATPIPRTLNFALNGIRDLSVINTPPVDRLAVKTYTCYFDEITIKEAILKEIRRGGQVYFIHNRVQSIEKMAKQISKLVPEARVRIGHGQMEEGALEKVMIDFMNHDFDVFVCTTIVESGVDIPNANTMLINRADNFGLAQLYQLRGRVGRSSHQAYCYLIVPQESLITKKAKKRLAVIQKFTELGSGFKIASHDLEIRGAGNILGDEQSGHIAAIGYDLYIQLLNQAIHELKNQDVPEDFEPEIQLSMPSKIPDDFIMDAQLRLILYKQVSSAEDLEEVEEIREEWQDRFGKLPVPIENLLSLIKVKILCKNLLISQLKQSGQSLFFSFHENHRIDSQVFVNLVQKNPKVFSMTKDKRFQWRMNDKNSITRDLIRWLQELG